MRLNFGKTYSGYGQHTLGRFECSGKVTIDGMPTSCADLRIIGHTLNGFYLINGTKKNIETVYCDFTQQQSDISKSSEPIVLKL